MEKYRAIPQGYMTVGQLAKKMNTTVRALQFYDKEGLLPPTTESEGGRRLYTDKDVILLHQIQVMKYLGFSLDDIKHKLEHLETPNEVAETLNEQATAMRGKIADLTETLEAMELLKSEVLQMQSVDFKKYAAIIVNLQMKNTYYGVIKYFDDIDLDIFQKRFDEESASETIQTISNLLDEAIQLLEAGIHPESEEGQDFVKIYWDKMIEFTGGNVNELTKYAALLENAGDDDSEWKKKHSLANKFIAPALLVYFEKQGENPFWEDPGKVLG